MYLWSKRETFMVYSINKRKVFLGFRLTLGLLGVISELCRCCFGSF